MPSAFWLLILTLIPVIATAQAPCVPPVTFATSATVSWTPPAQPPDVTTTGYRVQQQTDLAPYVDLAVVPATQATYLVANLPPGHTYTWRVTALGRLTTGATDESAPATPRADGTLPPCLAITVVARPTNLQALPQ